MGQRTTMTTLLVLMLLLLGSFEYPCESKLVQEEVDDLQQIVRTLGSTYWEFDDNSCQVKMVGLSSILSLNPDNTITPESTIGCNCGFENGTCHVVSITIKGYNLPGALPPELVKLPYIQDIDFAYNCLCGTIPSEWVSMQLKSISVLVNRLSGEIPKFLGEMTSLTYLTLEANQFSGNIPQELGNLINLQTLILSSNRLSGTLPATLADLKNLADFRINDNNLNGEIPRYIQNWKLLERLEMHASGLQGPIPSEISDLDNLTELSISDINGTTQTFPPLKNMTGIVRLVLRNCNIAGQIPSYIWRMQNLLMLDVSFNKLVGELPSDISGKDFKFIFLTSNLLTGDVADTILKDGLSIDLSYNNFTRQEPGDPTCQENMNLNINLFRSSTTESSLRRLLPCSDIVSCPRYTCSVHINSGGDDLTFTDSTGTFQYDGDTAVGGTATYFRNNKNFWGFSSTGDFMDDNNFQNLRFTENLQSPNLPELYRTARVSPISLTYFSYCLENGNYTVYLHFAELYFTNDHNYTSLGRRVFDIYIQDKLVKKDFNIEDEAGGAQKPLFMQFNASVGNNSLEIRFHWAGKGTTRIPKMSIYGPLVSAVVVEPNFKHCSNHSEKEITYITVGGVMFSFILIALGILWWWCYLSGIQRKEEVTDVSHPDHGELGGVESVSALFNLKQIKAATNNFDIANKIGEGGFGPVYKGVLPDGTIIAVKQLSSRSKQGTREFLNEVGMITCLQHPNLVRLHGCCAEGQQLLLIYEYMENNSLAHALFEAGNSQLILDWVARVKICIGIARGLLFLHEESRLRIVHRDIKATNVLLDSDLNPKISDFGMARLGEEEKTHVITRVAGTMGYMAPEYALWGYLTCKADVYSYGVVVLEIISGKSNSNFVPNSDCICLLDWASQLRERGKYSELVDDKLGCNVNFEEVERLVKVALLCTNGSPSVRPAMSDVVNILDDRLAIPAVIPEPGAFCDDMRSKAMRDIFRHKHNGGFSQLQTQDPTTLLPGAPPILCRSHSVQNFTMSGVPGIIPVLRRTCSAQNYSTCETGAPA